MSLKYGKREISKLATVLDADHESVEDAAQAALQAMEEIFADRAKFVVVGQLKGSHAPVLVALDWYSTEGEAKSAASSLVWSHGNPEEVFRTAVVPMLHTTAAKFHQLRRTERDNAERGLTQAEKLIEILKEPSRLTNLEGEK